MNKNPDLASSWKGRVLIMYYSEETKNPKMVARTMHPQMLKDASPFFKIQNYEIIAEIGAGICLPDNAK
jgi:hypothetical protein